MNKHTISQTVKTLKSTGQYFFTIFSMLFLATLKAKGAYSITIPGPGKTTLAFKNESTPPRIKTRGGSPIMEHKGGHAGPQQCSLLATLFALLPPRITLVANGKDYEVFVRGEFYAELLEFFINPKKAFICPSNQVGDQDLYLKLICQTMTKCIQNPNRQMPIDIPMAYFLFAALNYWAGVDWKNKNDQQEPPVGQFNMYDRVGQAEGLHLRMTAISGSQEQSKEVVVPIALLIREMFRRAIGYILAPGLIPSGLLTNAGPPLLTLRARQKAEGNAFENVLSINPFVHGLPKGLLDRLIAGENFVVIFDLTKRLCDPKAIVALRKHLKSNPNSKDNASGWVRKLERLEASSAKRDSHGRFADPHAMVLYLRVLPGPVLEVAILDDKLPGEVFWKLFPTIQEEIANALQALLSKQSTDKHYSSIPNNLNPRRLPMALTWAGLTES